MQDKTTFPNNADSLAEYFRLHPEQAPDANVGNADLTASDVPTEIETAAAAGELAAPDEPNPLSEEMDAQPASDPLFRRYHTLQPGRSRPLAPRLAKPRRELGYPARPAGSRHPQ